MEDVQQTVLLVESNTDATAPIRSLLEREGVAVSTVVGPSDVGSRAGEPSTRAVLVPMGLPDIDAAEIVGVLRSGGARSWIPVIVLDAGSDRRARLELIRLGADDVLPLDGDPDELLVRLRRSVSLKDRFDTLSREAEHLHQLSITDGLTRVHNHRFFQERLKEEFRRAQRYDDPLALVLLDVDHFKAVNDQYGHVTGDEVLRDVAEAIRQAVRDTDLLARYGGEEFSILLPRTHLAGALTVAERVWRGIGALRSGPQRSVQVTASLGVSGFPSRAVQSAEQLLSTADEALYRAKREGRNKICLFRQVSFFSEPPANAC